MPEREEENCEWWVFVVGSDKTLGFEDYLPGTLEAAFTSSPLLFQSFYNSNTLLVVVGTRHDRELIGSFQLC